MLFGRLFLIFELSWYTFLPFLAFALPGVLLLSANYMLLKFGVFSEALFNCTLAAYALLVGVVGALLKQQLTKIIDRFCEKRQSTNEEAIEIHVLFKNFANTVSLIPFCTVFWCFPITHISFAFVLEVFFLFPFVFGSDSIDESVYFFPFFLFYSFLF